METRKLQLIGGGTSYAVSLPKGWVESLGLQAGDEISIATDAGGDLHLAGGPPKPTPRRQRHVAITSNDADEILRVILGAYVSGFDVAVLDHNGIDPQAVRTAVGEACARLHGVQIVEEEPTRMVLEDLSATDGLGDEKGLRRMQAIALQMLANVGRMLDGGQAAILRENERFEAEMDRLLLFLFKQHTASVRRGASGGAASPATLHGMMVAHFLERIGDYALRVSGMVHSMGDEAALASPVRQAVQDVLAIVGDAMKAFNTSDAALANQAIRKALAFSPSEAMDSVIDVFTAPRAKPQLPSCVRCLKYSTLLESLERIALYSKSVAETAIDVAMLQDEA